MKAQLHLPPLDLAWTLVRKGVNMVLNVYRNHKVYYGRGEGGRGYGGGGRGKIYTEREREREREYNKVQARFVLETFYSECSPLRALSRPARSA